MPNRIKKIWRFIKKHQRDGLILLLVLSTWAFIANTIMYLTPLSGLDRFEGEVSSISIKTYKCSGSGRFSWTTCAKTEIKLSNSTKIFRLREKASQGGLNIDVSAKDTVVIYIRHWYQFFLTLGTWNGICQIEKDGEILYEYNWIKENNLMYMMAGGFVCLFSLVFLMIEIYTEKNVRKKYANTKPPVITFRENDN